MYNTSFPTQAELPSTARLIRSTIIAGVSALAILVTVVLPSEYGVDLTGFGRLTGLTTMGEIKMQLAEEAAAAEQLSAQVATGTAPIQSSPPVASAEISALTERISAIEAVLAPASVPETNPTIPTTPVSAAPAPVAAEEPAQASASAWRDEISFTLTPMEGTEYKLVMDAGAVANFEVEVQGGVINFDAHGEGGGQSVTYEQVRGISSESGQLQPPFAGTHGWFFRNRGDMDVTVTLRTGGQYSELRKLI
ncbi:hypothetical protein [Devosia salina]|uniref:Transmembrane anchor protein n=1 Tax=Devosia salina TaxID=2860336 RepID=A0ABX8W9C2_9HYPH|nr:hypothetical protein [Devosia salina]QYO75565.1 hypothetical protein K1X15_13080 [Devosia salina]